MLKVRNARYNGHSLGKRPRFFTKLNQLTDVLSVQRWVENVYGPYILESDL